MSARTHPTTDAVTPTFWGVVRLVALREITTRVRQKSFLWMSGLFVAAALAATVVPNLMAGADPVPVAVVGQAPENLEELEDGEGTAYFDVTEPDTTRDDAERLLRDGEVEAVLVFEDAGVTVLGLREPPTRAVQAFSVGPAVELIDSNGRDPMIVYFITLAFSLTFFLAVSIFGTQIAQSVVEEKQTRIVEILLSAISARALLVGKVLGNSALAVGQIALMAAAALAGLAATGDVVSLGDVGAPILWFVAFFVLGFVLMAAMFSATASLVSRSEEIGAATSPVMTLVMIPYILSFVAANNETVTRVLAWVPFSAPLSMPSLVYTGDAAWWEPIGALALLAVTTVVVLMIGEKIYSNSLLRTGSRVKLKDAFRKG